VEVESELSSTSVRSDARLMSAPPPTPSDKRDLASALEGQRERVRMLQFSFVPLSMSLRAPVCCRLACASMFSESQCVLLYGVRVRA